MRRFPILVVTAIQLAVLCAPASADELDEYRYPPEVSGRIFSVERLKPVLMKGRVTARRDGKVTVEDVGVPFVVKALRLGRSKAAGAVYAEPEFVVNGEAVRSLVTGEEACGTRCRSGSPARIVTYLVLVPAHACGARSTLWSQSAHRDLSADERTQLLGSGVAVEVECGVDRAPLEISMTELVRRYASDPSSLRDR